MAIVQVQLTVWFLTFSISTERHRAEVRRAVNDEKLATIADKWVRPDSS